MLADDESMNLKYKKNYFQLQFYLHQTTNQEGGKMEHYYICVHLELFMPKTLYLDVILICDLYLM